MVLAAEGRKANDSHADCYQYFCVPEYGTANGRLHFHAVHFMRTLPTGSVDPNFGRRVRNRRQVNSLQNTWPYGYSMPIAVFFSSRRRHTRCLSDWSSDVCSSDLGSSSFFTALVFWAILKWEDEAEKPEADRWIIFIFYMMGLSIGVHLLNLLTIPAIVMVRSEERRVGKECRSRWSPYH